MLKQIDMEKFFHFGISYQLSMQCTTPTENLSNNLRSQLASIRLLQETFDTYFSSIVPNITYL